MENNNKMDHNIHNIHNIHDIEGYVLRSKRQINIMLREHNYSTAFNILVMVLSKLDDANRSKFISYYDDYIRIMNEERYTENSRSLFPVSRY
jgi:hypothetical protein